MHACESMSTTSFSIKLDREVWSSWNRNSQTPGWIGHSRCITLLSANKSRNVTPCLAEQRHYGPIFYEKSNLQSKIYGILKYQECQLVCLPWHLTMAETRNQNGWPETNRKDSLSLQLVRVHNHVPITSVPSQSLVFLGFFLLHRGHFNLPLSPRLRLTAPAADWNEIGDLKKLDSLDLPRSNSAFKRVWRGGRLKTHNKQLHNDATNNNNISIRWIRWKSERGEDNRKPTSRREL